MDFRIVNRTVKLIALAFLLLSPIVIATQQVDPYKIPKEDSVNPNIYDDWSKGERWVLKHQLDSITKWQERELQSCRTARKDCQRSYQDNSDSDYTTNPLNSTDLCQHAVDFCMQRTQDTVARGRAKVKNIFEQSVNQSVVKKPKNLALADEQVDVIDLLNNLSAKNKVPAFLNQEAVQPTEDDSQ